MHIDAVYDVILFIYWAYKVEMEVNVRINNTLTLRHEYK